MITSERTKEQDKMKYLVGWLMEFKQRDELKYGLLTMLLLFFLNLKHRRKSMLDGRFVLSLRRNKTKTGKNIKWRFFFLMTIYNWKPLEG